MDTNPQTAAGGSPAAVVAGAYQTGVVLMRSLARRGVRVYCIDCDTSRAGFRTVYGRAFACPDPDEQPEAWLRFMTELSGRLGDRPVLIPTADRFVSAIAAHAAGLRDHFRFCDAAAPVHALLATKQRQYELAAANGLPVSRTRFVRSATEVAEFASTARFPCLFKPLHEREWRGVPPGHPLFEQKLVLADSADDLASKYRMIAEVNPEGVVQEIIEGPDTAKLVYLSCYSREGHRIANCMVREVRTTPIHFGSASVVEPAWDAGVDAMCDRFLHNIGYLGLCEIELKRDNRDGQVKMIEANPRFTVTSDAAFYAGVDLGWAHYLDLIGVPVTPVSAEARHFRHIVLQRDSLAFRSYLREGLETWGSLIRSYRRPVAFFDFDLRDWRVTAGTARFVLRALVGPPLRRIFPKRY